MKSGFLRDNWHLAAGTVAELTLMGLVGYDAAQGYFVGAMASAAGLSVVSLAMGLNIGQRSQQNQPQSLQHPSVG